MQADDLILKLPSVEFKRRDILPSISGIYYVVDENNLIWYIGQAQNLYSRWRGNSHHRLFQLLSQKKKKFQIYYKAVVTDVLDEIERSEIIKYSPHLNQSSIKRKNVYPTETLLRETLIKLSGYLVILGVEPPRKLDIHLIEKCYQYREDWWVHKKITSLDIIHVAIEMDKWWNFFTEYEHSVSILKHIFSTRRNYANKWESPSEIKKSRYKKNHEAIRLIANGYVVEMTAINYYKNLFDDVFQGTLANEKISILPKKPLESLKVNGNKTYIGSFSVAPEYLEQVKERPRRLILSRLQPYQEDAIKLVFKEKLNYSELQNIIPKLKLEYERGLRGFGSRSK
jgi:hypothetical protein